MSKRQSHADALAPVLARLSERSQRPMTLDGLLARWKKFVTEVEGGYPLTIYDYTNDLGVRRLLEEVVTAVPHEVADAIRERLEDSDERFRSATRPAERAIDGTARERHEWWAFRIPWRLGDELRSDLGL